MNWLMYQNEVIDAENHVRRRREGVPSFRFAFLVGYPRGIMMSSYGPTTVFGADMTSTGFRARLQRPRLPTRHSSARRK